MERAESQYREALALAEPRGMLTLYREMGMTYWLEKTEAQVN